MLRRLFSTATTAPGFRSGLPPTIKQLLASPSIPVGTGTPPAAAAAAAENVQVHGWIKSVRRQKRVAFAVVSDGSSARGLQAVFRDPELAKPLTNGASVRLTGRLVESLGKGQDRELQVDGVDVIGECDPEVSTYPIQKQALSTEYLRDHCHLRTKTDAIASMLRLRDGAASSFHHHFRDLGFVYTHTPVVTSNDCEGAGETFRITHPSPVPSSPDRSPSRTPQAPAPPSTDEFFGRPAYLTVSSQLHLESLAAALSRVYTLGPCFRAERSQTGRHLAEFWMLEAEWTFVDRVRDVCDVVEGSVKRVLRDALAGAEVDEARRAALEDAARADKAWARMSYTQAVRALEASGRAFAFEPRWGQALQSEHERWLAESLVGGPVFVTDYPAALKPFYMRANDDDDDDGRRTVACFDLLVPQLGELAGGSLREHRVHLLEEAIGRHGLEREAYEWYVDLRRYGGAPHGGFGLGFERLIGWVGGVENVRECIAMPRWAGRMLL
ncbi:asparaginyl-tRNA synthetase [Punctularia strigosozonata HHB-11173 SS5]|uniref:asparaginyl-tRNA synthetase n=1 Tax=Punctularia strigosozonata (strain HHB-11173) TaxID=741275 RepID=UPI0004416D8D|nr:asparaginyl-tRNA synthetase [Punctularia strigosozonata HHB-11173 SS5]EIN08654.1 asparaginyl-tRNA synthetase [Punctularia strigosozonata HHB-11173 SS5]